ncbi:Intraflagellar transport protein 46, partial [Thoreauomyces humboldtii]
MESDLAAGIEPTQRPFSAIRNHAPSRSDGAIDTDGLADDGSGSLSNPTPLRQKIQNQLHASRDHVSHHDLVDAPGLAVGREDGIDRSGAVHDLTTAEEDERRDSSAFRSSALKGGLVTSSTLSANLASNPSLRAARPQAKQHQQKRASRDDAEDVRYGKEDAAMEDDLEKDDGEGDEDEEEEGGQSESAPLTHEDSPPRGRGVAPDDLDSSSSSSPVPPQPAPAEPRRGGRPESARRSVQRQAQAKSDSEEEDNLDMYIKASEETSSRSPVIKETSRQRHRHRDSPQNPPRTDSMPRSTMHLAPQDSFTDVDSIFPESKPPGIPDGGSIREMGSAASNAQETYTTQFTELFAFIDAYQPQDCDIPQQLQCFIPDYMPCIGDIDPMIKVGPPSRYPDQPSKAVDLTRLPNLGITVLDEPSPNQSDPSVLDLHIRALNKAHISSGSTSAPAKIRSILLGAPGTHDDGGMAGAQQVKALTQWIQNMGTLRSQRRTDAAVAYAKPMPDVETLMHEWPEDVEKAFQTGEITVPSADIDLSLPDYAQLACNMIDIPVHPRPASSRPPNEARSHVDALHVLFTLYLEFKTSQHFGHRSHRVGV